MTAPVGAVVGLYYDSPREVAPGDALATGTGRMYLILEARRQEDGKHRGRWHLRCRVVASVSDDTTIHPIRWYRRRKKRRPVLIDGRSAK